MANKGIDFVLSLSATKFQAGLNAITSKTKAAGGAVQSYWKNTEVGAQRAGNAFASMQAKVVGAIAAIGGIYAVKATFDSVTAAAMESDKAAFNLGTSIQAANREFKVGASQDWARNVKQLTEELKVYSSQAVTQAAAKTIDMTKRLGLSEQQMLKVIRAAANLSAGKFDLSEGVERVTAALRGEAEASEALGLTLSENYVKGWYEAHNAHGKAWKDLNDLEKAQVRYNVLLQQSDPLIGKAAKSAGIYSGALTGLTSNFETIKSSIGETVTRNNFFIEGIGKISSFIKGLDADVDGNRQKWMEWSKQSTLAVLDFSIAGIKATSSLYSAFSGISGGIKETLAYYYELKGAFLEGAASGAKWKDALGITSGEAQRLGSEAETAARKADALRASASRSFAEMEAGAPKIQAAAESLQKFRDTMAQVEAKEIIPEDLEGKSQKVQQEIVKIGDKWVNVAKTINEEPVKPIVEIEQEAYQKSIDLLRRAVENQAKSAEEVNERAARGASGSWDAAADDFELSWSRAISAIESKLSRLAARASSSGASGSYSQGGPIGAYKIGGLIQALASGGGVRRMLAGGAFPGFGGGDRRLVLAEDGEYMLDKYRVRDAGWKAVRAFHRGDYATVISELSTRVRDRMRYALGGMIGSLPSPPQRLAVGGVVGGSGSGDIMTIKLDFGPGRSVPVQASRTDAARIKKEFDRMHRMRSA